MRLRLPVALACAALLAGCSTTATTTADQQGAAPPPAHSPAKQHPRADDKPAARKQQPTGLRSGERFRTVSVDQRYRPAAPNGGTDDYRCFLLDPQLARPSYLTGVRFQPGDERVVHHAILFSLPASGVAAAKAQDASTPGEGWTCFGGPTLPTATDLADPMALLNSAPWLAAWAPGGGEQVFPRGLGVPIGANERIILQVHYNLLAGDRPDRTSVGLRLAPGDADLTALQTMLFPAPVEVPCPAGVRGPLCDRDAAVQDLVDRFGPQAGFALAGLQMLCGGDAASVRAGRTRSCDRTVTEPATVVAAAGHMHLLGRSIQVEVNPDTPQARTLLDIPVWNFDDQSARPLAEPVQLARGDVVRVTCTHDARLRDRLPALADTEPRYVVWGEGTTDEMCLGVLVVTRP